MAGIGRGNELGGILEVEIRPEIGRAEIRPAVANLGIVVLEQPGGDVLRLLLSRSREGLCSHPRSDVLREAVRQLTSWGFAEFVPLAHSLGQYRYRVTALGVAADRWGWASRLNDSRASSRPSPPPPGGITRGS